MQNVSAAWLVLLPLCQIEITLIIDGQIGVVSYQTNTLAWLMT